jgi:hypothetical protein
LLPLSRLWYRRREGRRIGAQRGTRCESGTVSPL